MKTAKTVTKNQITWKPIPSDIEYHGFYKDILLFNIEYLIVDDFKDEIAYRLSLNPSSNMKCLTYGKYYKSLSSAKRGAEKILRELQKIL